MESGAYINPASNYVIDKIAQEDAQEVNFWMPTHSEAMALPKSFDHASARTLTEQIPAPVFPHSTPTFEPQINIPDMNLR